MKSVLGFILILFSFLAGSAQLNLQEVKGLPTNELYDLHVDKRGYLWIAHDLGISRFDGLNFLHFSHPGQSSLSMNDITEDNEGRIWCHNLSGQVFYIEKGKLTLLTDYEATKETQYPRIALCGNELLATSDRGLFICSTTNLKCRYLLPGKNNPALSSLAVIGSKAVLYNKSAWYLYSKERGITKLIVDSSIHFAVNNLVSVQSVSVGTTFFVTANPSGIVQMISLKEDSLKLQATLEMNDFTNGVTISDHTWIHSRNESKTLDEKWTIKGQSLTDVVKDHEGNTWFSSLKKGLLVDYKKPQWQMIHPPVENEDFVRCLNVADGYFFAGTNKGNLLVLDTSLTKISWQKILFDGYGSIDFIRFFKNHTFVAGSSVNTYIVNPVEKQVKNLLPLSSVKDVDFDENSLYIATTNGFYMMPFVDSIDFPVWQQVKQIQFSFLKSFQSLDGAYLFTANRSWAVRYDQVMRNLFVSFKNGLHRIDERGIHPFYINNKPVFTSSLWYKNPRLFISTFSDGLWIKTKKKLRHFTTENFLTSNTILRTKATENHLWLFENETMQVMDIQTETLLKNLDLPKINGANVFDVAEWLGYGYLTTAEGIYKIPMNTASEDRMPTGYLDAVIINNKDTLKSENVSLPYNSNDLQFILSSPAFYDPSNISFRYRIGGLKEDWQTTKPGERLIRYASLPPGTYKFEAFAVNNKNIQQKEKIEFEVTINKPWWKRWWFYSLIVILLSTLIYFLYKYQVSQLLKVEKVRRNISSDLHDDIGATLSSINIYTELAKNEKNNNEYLDAIQQHSNEVTGKLDDLIWSINPRNDSFDKLVSRMHSYALPLLQAKHIACTFSFNESLLKEKLQVQVKQNLYLVFKELVNNVMKHSGAQNCFVNLTWRDNLIIFSVKDDGKGYDTLKEQQEGNGIINMKERVEKMRGHIEIQSAPKKGTFVLVYIPLPYKYVGFFKKWISKF
jgi:two-component sensor histidine kinase/ligand-binding sensor domain-containing protein